MISYKYQNGGSIDAEYLLLQQEKKRWNPKMNKTPIWDPQKDPYKFRTEVNSPQVSKVDMVVQPAPIKREDIAKMKEYVPGVVHEGEDPKRRAMLDQIFFNLTGKEQEDETIGSTHELVIAPNQKNTLEIIPFTKTNTTLVPKKQEVKNTVPDYSKMNFNKQKLIGFEGNYKIYESISEDGKTTKRIFLNNKGEQIQEPQYNTL